MLRLFGLAHAGGSAAALALLRNQLPAALEFQALELPGRGVRRRERLHAHRPTLVEQLARELAPQSERPYALFGHSLGAILAFELAHALIARGCPAPRVLFVAAAAAPRMRPENYGKGRLSDRELEQELRDMGGTPAEIFEHPQLLELCLPIVRADFQLCDGVSNPNLTALPCPLHVYAGKRDKLSLEQLSPWRDETEQTFSLTWFDGDHFFVKSHVDELAKTMLQQLPMTL